MNIQYIIQVVILGDSHIGKTSLVTRFAEGYYRENSRPATESPQLVLFYHNNVNACVRYEVSVISILHSNLVWLYLIAFINYMY